MTTADALPAHPVTTKTLPPGKLTRTAVARTLGVSVSTVRRLEGATLHPEIGPGNVRLFDLRAVEVLRTTRLRISASSSDEDSGELAATVFSLLDDGVHPVDVVKQLRLAPATAEALHAQWARMRRKLAIDVHDIERAVGRDWSPDFPSAREVLGSIREALKCLCDDCHKPGAALCRQCVGARLIRARGDDRQSRR